MSTPPHVSPATSNQVKYLLALIAFVLFLLAALFFFGVGNVKDSTSFGLIAAGLAASVLASVIP